MVTRRQGLSALGGLAVSTLFAGNDLFATATGEQAATPFSHETVVEIARARAREQFVDRSGAVPRELAELDYDQYRDIRFDPAQALLADDPAGYRIQLFHLGFLYASPVRVNIVRNGVSSRVAFSREAFDYGATRIDADLPPDMGFAGIRVHFPLNVSTVLDELIVFLGASYFRFLSAGLRYGLSARGLAIDTALEKGEEFPLFSEFWIEAPGGVDVPLVIHALLDSPSTTGAYRFIVTPGAMTAVDVEVVLFPRSDIRKLGIAPMTSMYLHGEPGLRQFADFRPEVHDSDGLLMATGAGEWIWRPLVNPYALAVNSFSDRDPRGFGLLQRDRQFSNYQDLEAHYERRPSYWVQPKGDWGEGRVELIEIPADIETNDNIVAYWVPRQPIEAGGEYRFAYRLQAVRSGDSLHPGAKVVATRVSEAKVSGVPTEPGTGERRFLLDFEGGRIGYYRAEISEFAIDVSASTGNVKPSHVTFNEETGGVRAAFDFVPDGETPANLRAFLRIRNEALSETWSLSWPVPGS